MKLWVGIKHNWLSRLNRVESDCQHFHGGIPVKRLFTLMADISWKKKSANSIRASNECQTLRISAARKPKKQHDKSSINYRSIVNLSNLAAGRKKSLPDRLMFDFQKIRFRCKNKKKAAPFFFCRTSTPIGCANRWTGVGWESFSQMIFFRSFEGDGNGNEDRFSTSQVTPPTAMNNNDKLLGNRSLFQRFSFVLAVALKEGIDRKRKMHWRRFISINWRRVKQENRSNRWQKSNHYSWLILLPLIQSRWCATN